MEEKSWKKVMEEKSWKKSHGRKVSNFIQKEISLKESMILIMMMFMMLMMTGTQKIKRYQDINNLWDNEAYMMSKELHSLKKPLQK